MFKEIRESMITICHQIKNLNKNVEIIKITKSKFKSLKVQ